MISDDPGAESWPTKYDVFGVGVSATSYDAAAEQILLAASRRQSAVVDHMSAHGLVMATRDPEMRAALNRCDVVAPDGQPVRWALRWFHRIRLPDRVYGPELMRRLCAQAPRYGVSIYLLGGMPEVLMMLRRKLEGAHPGLVVAGAESPPFRPLSEPELDQLIDRINESGAGLVFLGLGCPKQELFASANRERIAGVQMCVGAAFDFLSETKPEAPAWMQARGLEWLFRLLSEPGRLWKRYAVAVPLFFVAATRQALRQVGESLTRGGSDPRAG